MKNKIYFKNKNSGMSILGFLVMGFIIILILSYLNVSIKGIIESPTGQENVNYIKDETKSVWVTYLKEPAEYLWNDILVNIFWKSFILNMERIRDGNPTDFEKAAPSLKMEE